MPGYRIAMECLWNTVVMPPGMPLEYPYNTLERPWNTPGAPLKCPWNAQKCPWNASEMPLECPWNPETPLECH